MFFKNLIIISVYTTIPTILFFNLLRNINAQQYYLDFDKKKELETLDTSSLAPGS